MATTDEVRRWYPDVVVNHDARGTPGYEPICDTSEAVRVEFPKEGGSVYRLLVHPKTADAWRVYSKLMSRFGETVPSAGGTHNCRNIGGSDWPSLHAYCTALDLPPNDRKSSSFQSAVLAVRTMSGAAVWKNGAGFDPPDRMHDQIDCSPAALASGIDPATIPDIPALPDQGDEMTPAQFASRLSPQQVDVVVNTRGEGGKWIVFPGKSDRAALTAEMTALLGNPADPKWVQFYEEVTTEALVNAAVRKAGPAAGVGELTLTGTFTGKAQ